MKKDFFDYLFYLITLLAAIAGIFAFYQTFAPDLNDQGKWGVIFLGVLVFWFMGHNMILISKYRKDARYKDLFSDINLAFAHLHKLNRYDASIKNDQYELHIAKTTEMLKNGLDFFARAFSKLTGSECSVCIKYIFKNKNDLLEVTTLIRDSASDLKRIRKENETIQHLVVMNTDFKYILNSLTQKSFSYKGYYICGNLPNASPYENTRLAAWPPEKSKIPFFDNISRKMNWPLPNMSTIVVPLLPLIKAEQTVEGLRGFLCIDSPKANAFNKKVDPEIVQGIADGLYNKIDVIYKLLKFHEVN